MAVDDPEDDSPETTVETGVLLFEDREAVDPSELDITDGVLLLAEGKVLKIDS